MIENITLYKSFMVAAQCESISAAARKLYITQPAVSSEILQLESLLGVKLFFRTSRGITLTPEGKELYEYVTNAFAYLEAGEEKIRNIKGLVSGILRIGASDMTLKFFLLNYLEQFHNDFPQVKISVTNAPTPHTLTALREGQIDFGVISDPIDSSEATDLFVIPVREIQDSMVCSQKYILHEKMEIDELKQYPIIMLEKETSTRRYIERELLAHGEWIEPDIELATSDLILEFAKRGIGIACIVEDFVTKELKDQTLQKVSLKNPFAPRRFLLVYLKKMLLSTASRKLLDRITKKEEKKTEC